MGGVVRGPELRTNISKIICKFTFLRYICTRKQAIREFSSAGSEHLPYKQRVGGSNPSTPTRKKGSKFGALFSCGSILPTIFTFPPPAPPFEKKIGRGNKILSLSFGLGMAFGITEIVVKNIFRIQVLILFFYTL